MNQAKTQLPTSTPRCIYRVDDWRNLHEIGPRPCNQINPLHYLASIRMNTHWMARWSSGPIKEKQQR
jgi:hypothetical protein